MTVHTITRRVSHVTTPLTSMTMCMVNTVITPHMPMSTAMSTAMSTVMGMGITTTMMTM